MIDEIGIGDLFNVSGKVVLVSGGSRGIGLSLAEGFVRAKARVYVSSRKADACEQTAQELSTIGECFSLPADLSTADGCRRLAAELAEREPHLDVLINNAGALWAQPLAQYAEAGWDKVFDLNVKGAFFLTQATLPLLKAAATPADPARVITIGSINGFHVPPHETYAYAASKAAVHHLSRLLAKALAGSHVTSNVIAPGMFASKMMEATITTRGEDAVLERVPLKRFVAPADMVGAAIFLASRAGSFVTGAILPVDGGTATTL
jgi:NAD(P)-dependent dehydrogenase (short-subunit alcohol dehydrogenase family)